MHIHTQQNFYGDKSSKHSIKINAQQPENNRPGTLV